MLSSDKEKFDIGHFEKLFKKNFDPFCKKVNSMLRDPEAAADLVQNVFLRFWQRRNEIKIESSLEAYLFRSCVNEAHNYITATKRREKILSGIERSEAVEASPEESFNLMETYQLVEQAIERLPPSCKEVFLLSRYDEKSHKEIAIYLNISENTVSNHIKKALKILKEHLLLILFIYNF